MTPLRARTIASFFFFFVTCPPVAEVMPGIGNFLLIGDSDSYSPALVSLSPTSIRFSTPIWGNTFDISGVEETEEIALSSLDPFGITGWHRSVKSWH